MNFPDVDRTPVTTKTARSLPTGPGRWKRNEQRVDRVAALPFEALDRLRDPDLASWSLSVLQLEGDVKREGVALADELYSRIAGEEDLRLRRVLIETRRRLFNNRSISAQVATVSERYAPELTDRLLAWETRRTQLADLIDAGTAVEAVGKDATALGLRDIVRHDLFRKGLILASPSLDNVLEGFLSTPVGQLSGEKSKRTRHIHESLVDYVYRVAAKTSPFSTFTGVQAAGPEASFVLGKSNAWTSQPRLNVVILTRLADAIKEADKVRDDLFVGLVPGMSHEANRIRYLQASVTNGDNTDTVAFDLVRDTLFYLRTSEHLTHIVDAFESASLIRRRDLIDIVAARYTGDPGDVRRSLNEYADSLLRLGFLWIPSLAQDVTWRDPVASFREALQEIGSRGLDECIACLMSVETSLQSYADAPPCRRRQLASSIRQELVKALESLGGNAAELPATTIFEDAVSTQRMTKYDSDSAQDQIASALEIVADLLPAFDLNRGLRHTLHGYFRARFGEEGQANDFEKFVQDFEQDINGQYRTALNQQPALIDGKYTATENWLDLVALKKLDVIRREWMELVRQAVANTDSGPISLPHADIEALASRVRDVEGPFSSQSFFVQVAGPQEAPDVVVNKAMPGLAFIFSRFTHCFPEGDYAFARNARETMKRDGPIGAVFAEVTGRVPGTNLNLHEPLTDFHIVLPAERSDRPREEQIPIDDLSVVWSSDNDQAILWSARLQARVIPVYSGYLVPTALPLIAKTLLMFSSLPMATIDPWTGVESKDARHRPRVNIGRAVLARESWSASKEELPQLTPGQSPADWYLSWRRWQAERCLPDRAYVVFEVAPGDDEGTNQDPAAWTPKSKPILIDFESPTNLTMIDRHLRRSGGEVLFVEAYPGVDDLYARSNEGSHLCEIAIELTRTEQGVQG